MDLATLIGFILCLGAIVFGIISGGQGFGTYVDIPSVFITVLGSFAATMMAYPLDTFKSMPKFVGKAFKAPNNDPAKTIRQIIELANKARKDGLLSLEEASNEMSDDFLKKGLMLIVDGTDPELVRNLLETELDFIEERHKQGQGFLEMLASMGPSYGMIGTLIGLIAMLKTMSDASSIGPSMAVALITTLYGSMLANMIFTPIANKLKVNSAVEILERQIMLEGLLSIQAGENPRIIEEKLKAFLPPSLRNSAEQTKGEA